MLKEIVTKAVISKGKIVDSSSIELEVADSVSRPIGCWVINHNYLCVEENNKLYASGYYDVHIWYAVDNNADTRIYKKTIEYKKEFNMENYNFEFNNNEYKTYCVEYPSCTALEYRDNKFIINIKLGLAIDVIGESKLLIQVSDNWNKEEENMGINVNYINK